MNNCENCKRDPSTDKICSCCNDFNLCSPMVCRNPFDLEALIPCAKYTNASRNQQREKLKEEVVEFEEACEHEGEDRQIEELLDVIQCGITFLEIYRRRGNDINKAIHKVRDKNRDWEYYTES